MSWLAKNLPTIFIDAPDGTTHSRFKGSYIFNDNGIDKIFIFKYKLLFVLQDTMYKIVREECDKIYTLLKSSRSNERLLENKNYEQANDIKNLEENFKEIEISKNLLEDSYQKSLENNINLNEDIIKLRNEISKLNVMLEERKQRILDKELEKEGLKKWFDSEINYREETIKSLREIINKFREDVDALLVKTNENNSKNIDKLRKELELLDRDFVDVAKAMKVYRKDEERPVRGFRIKLD